MKNNLKLFFKNFLFFLVVVSAKSTCFWNIYQPNFDDISELLENSNKI